VSHLLQIVPSLDPNSGVASHARKLAQALVAHTGLPSRFLVCDPGASTAGEAAVSTLSARAAELLAASLGSSDDPVLLHYSNYGYERRGCPRWLVDGLEAWRGAAARSRLLTAFHELYATGLPWQSSFWLSPLQRRLAARTRELSDGAVTSLERYEAALREWAPTKPVRTLPVFSTVGEPAEPAPLDQRRPAMVVFGSAGLRARAYRGTALAILRACLAMGIEAVLDVGPGDAAPPSIGSVPVRRLGHLPEAEVSGLLGDSRAGFVAYPAAFVPKSTVFAAYCAHRLVPVCSWPSANGVGPEGHWWDPDRTAQPQTWQALADSAHEWYQGHTLAQHAALYASLLQ
jgi:hypothetical protein